METRKDTIYLGKPLDKGYGLSLWSDNFDLVRLFKETCFGNLSHSVRWFLQSDNPEYVFFEFWTDNQDAILNEAFRISKLTNLPLEIF